MEQDRDVQIRQVHGVLFSLIIILSLFVVGLGCWNVALSAQVTKMKLEGGRVHTTLILACETLKRQLDTQDAQMREMGEGVKLVSGYTGGELGRLEGKMTVLDGKIEVLAQAMMAIRQGR